MIAASASTTEVAFSILMTGYLVTALWTLASIGSEEREGDRPSLSPAAPARQLRAPLVRLILASTPVVLAVGLGIFFLIPHYGTGYFREKGRSIRRNLSGFSDRIELGSIGRIKKSHATVMRIHQPGRDAPPQLPLRLRGIALDRFNGRVWDLSDQGRRPLRRDAHDAYVVDSSNLAAGSPRTPAQRAGILSLQILLEPLQTRVLFTPSDLISVTTKRFHTVESDRHGGLYAGGPRSRRFSYGTASLLHPPERPAAGVAPLNLEETPRFLQLPPLDPRVVDLALRVAAGAGSAAEKGRALEVYLRENYGYSLDVNDSAVRDPLSHLLIDRQPGHCEYFATALAVMLRVNDVPSRVVTGFNGGEHSELTGRTIIRQSDAHSWVEAWFPASGWTILDATPPDPGAFSPGLLARLWTFLDEAEIAWDTYIVGLDLQDQKSALEEVVDWFDLAAAGAVIHLRAAAAALRELAGITEGGLPASDTLLGITAALILAAVLPMAAFIGWRRFRHRGSAPHPATVLFRRFEKMPAHRGRVREAWVSPGEFARQEDAPAVAEAYEAARYGPADTLKGALDRLRSLVTARPES
jgi:hypothetical protein